MGGRPGLPGIAIENAAVSRVVATNGGLSTWGFKCCENLVKNMHKKCPEINSRSVNIHNYKLAT